MDAMVYAAKRNAVQVTRLAREWMAADESDGRVRNALTTVNGVVWVAVVLRVAGVG